MLYCINSINYPRCKRWGIHPKEIELIANFWLRSGDAHTANYFKAFLEETLSFFGSKKIGLLRLDSGFYDKNIFDYLEREDVAIDYIIAVPMYVTVQRKIAAQQTCLHIEDGIEIAEFEYKVQDWTKGRRMIALRQKIAKRPKAVGKQLSLFEDDYKLKYDNGLDKMNQDGFDGTEACLLLMTIAYNFMSLFKQIIITDKVRNRLSTLRYKMLTIPAYIRRTLK